MLVLFVKLKKIRYLCNSKVKKIYLSIIGNPKD